MSTEDLPGLCVCMLPDGRPCERPPIYRYEVPGREAAHVCLECVTRLQDDADDLGAFVRVTVLFP